MSEGKCCDMGLCESDAEYRFVNSYGEAACVCGGCAQRYFNTELVELLHGPREPDGWWVYTNMPEFEETEMIAEAEHNARMDYLNDMREAG